MPAVKKKEVKKPVKKVLKKPVKKSSPKEKAKNPEVQQLREELFKEKVVDTIERDVVEITAESSKEVEKEEGGKVGSVVQETEEELLAAEAKIKEAPASSESEKVEEREEESRPKDDQPLAEKVEEELAVLPEEKEKSSKKSLLVLGIIFLFIGAILGIFIFSSMQFFGASIVPEREEEPAVPTEEPTATPEPELSFDTYQLQVLNGSGVSGQAASTAQLLEDKLGFSSENTDTGNAPDEVEDTTVQLKAEVPEEAYAKIKEVLSGFNVTLGDPLSEDSSYDIVVTLGQQE